MKKIFFFFSLFAILWLVSACPIYDPPTNELTINNHSDSAVYIYATCKDFLESDKKLKLFLKHKNKSRLDQNGDDMGDFSSPEYRINAYSIQSHMRSIDSNCKNKESINFFFISESTMRKYTWKEICENNLVLKKLTFSKGELDKKDWIVHFYP